MLSVAGDVLWQLAILIPAARGIRLGAWPAGSLLA